MSSASLSFVAVRDPGFAYQGNTGTFAPKSAHLSLDQWLNLNLDLRWAFHLVAKLPAEGLFR
jgi:hypothetical protein